MLDQLRAAVRLDRSVHLYLLTSLCTGFAYFGVGYLISNLYLASLGFDTVFIGNLNGIGLLALTLVALPAGMIGARYGLRGATAAGYGISAAGMALFLLSTLLPVRVWPGAIIVSNAIGYIGGAVFLVNGTPYLMQIAPEDQRKRAFTFSGTFVAVGSLLGNLSGGFLPDYLLKAGNGGINQATAYQWTMWLVVAGYLLGAVIMLKTKPAAAVQQMDAVGAREKAPVGLLVFLGLLFIVQLFNEGSFVLFMNLYLAQEFVIPNSMIGTVFAAGKPLTIMGAPLVLYLMKKLGAGRTMTVMYIVSSGCALLLAWFGTPFYAITGTILTTITFNFAATARNLFGQEAVSPQWRTMISAVNSISWSVGTGIAAFAGGWIIAGSGYSMLFFVSAGAALTVILLYAFYERFGARPRARHAGAPAA